MVDVQQMEIRTWSSLHKSRRQKHPVNDVCLQNGTSKFKVVKLFLLPGLVPCGTARAFVWSAHPWLVDVWLVGAGTLLQGPWPHLSPIYSFRVAIPQHLTTCGFCWGAGSGKNRAEYTASPCATLRGYVSAKMKRIDCFLESASFIGCQANKALVAETSAVQQTGREKTWQKSAEWRSKTGRLKTWSHQVYADSNGILWPGMLPRRPLSLEPFFLKLDTWWWSISFSFWSFQWQTNLSVLQYAQWSLRRESMKSIIGCLLEGGISWYFKGSVCPESLCRHTYMHYK